jgi:hypothetical protein
MRLIEHAGLELRVAAKDGDLAATPDMRNAILRVVQVFAEQGHSGGSASIVGPRVAWVIERLLAFEPITPLTGEPHEWVDISEHWGEEGCYQNKRCSHIFKDGDVAYNIEAIVFKERGGGVYQNGVKSARRVTFPYVPQPPKVVPAWQKNPRYWWAKLTGEARP